MTPFDTNWEKGGSATPLTIQDLFLGDAISIPTAPASFLLFATVEEMNRMIREGLNASVNLDLRFSSLRYLQRNAPLLTVSHVSHVRGYCRTIANLN